ncbi:MAG: copper resistance protein CopC/CopD [Solirubrobacteraceae bacterium]|nr:copper resistance protein CopC/CopD [Solirubrobacteraceae bacterium]
MALPCPAAPRAALAHAVATLIATLTLIVLVALTLPAAAAAHARLVDAVPAAGAVVATPPSHVELAFDEPIEAAFGAVRVHDGRGDRVDVGEPFRPGRSDRRVGVRVPADLPTGAYTVTYRVISADGHPVSGGVVFSVGHDGARPTVGVDDLLADDAGPVTRTAFGVVRATVYASTAVTVGSLLFLVAAWRPARRRGMHGRDRDDGPDPTDRRFVALTWRTVTVGALVTATGSALGLVLQAAVAGGGSFWAAWDVDAVADVAGTRYGRSALARSIAALALVVIASTALWRRRSGEEAAARPSDAPTAPSARSAGPRASAVRAATGVAVACGAVLVLSPGLGGHAGATSPRAVLVPADALHVLAMAAWLGGLLVLLVLLPRAVAPLSAGRRTVVTAAVVDRFSPVAIAAVAALVVTGVVQSVVHLAAPGDLVDTAFGRAITLKALLLVGMLVIADHNRRRLAPRLRALAADDAPPGATGAALRSALRAEVALAVAVLGVTAALVSYAPGGAPAAGTDSEGGWRTTDGSAAGSLATSTTAGPVRVDLHLAPLRVGDQALHLDLRDARTGAPWRAARTVEVTAREPDAGLGPIAIAVRRTGPGRYVARGPLVAVPGRWRLRVAVRVSAFDLHATTVTARVR